MTIHSRWFHLFTLSWSLGLVVSTRASEQAQHPEGRAKQGYYRFPTVHGDQIVFTAEGDLWRVGLVGGIAQRLTTHPGSETHAAFSPDGHMLAFSAEYEG